MSPQEKVGYGKPPKKTRFKKGQSGNRRGRPKGSKNLVTHLKDELRGTVRIQENGVAKAIPRAQALAKSMVNEAIRGKDGARRQVIELERQQDRTADDGGAGCFSSVADQKLLERFVERFNRKTKETPK